MKLFQRLLVAPAALGLMVPMAANASEQLNNVTDRVDTIEESIDGLEAGVFSNQQTKLSGNTTFIISGYDEVNGTGGSTWLQDFEATVFNYDTIIDVDSSFSGDDLLRIRLRAGNFFLPQAGAVRENNLVFTGAELERGFFSNDVVVVNRAYYQFPIGDDFTATFGPMVRQDDMLGVWPSDYPSDSILDSLTYAGARNVYRLHSGAGFGLNYLSSNGRWSVTLLSQHLEGDLAWEETSGLPSWGGGIGTEAGFDSVTGQLAYIGDRWRIALAKTYSDGGQNWDQENPNQYDAWGLAGVYQIDQGRTDDTTLIPSSISAGIGWTEMANEADALDWEDSRTYTIGVVWNDALSEGNSFGIAWGTADEQINDRGYDDPHSWEVYYAMGINDNITVTPAFFQVQRDDADDINGLLLKTTFTF